MMRFRGALLCLVLGAPGVSILAQSADVIRIASPAKAIVLTIAGGSEGEHYAVTFHDKPLISDSPLGLKLEGQAVLGKGMQVGHVERSSTDETYTIPVGKVRTVRNYYNAVRVELKDGLGRRLTIEARVYDDGVAFRYVLPEQATMKSVRIEREETEFHYSKDAVLYPLILDGFQSSYEDEYQMRQVSGLHHDWLMGLPLLAEVPGVGWAAITEADIENYAGMYLRKGDAEFALRAELSPRTDQPQIAVETEAQVTTPWRVLMVGDEPGRLIESNLILNLNPASKIADTSWIKAGKSAWDWWSGDAATGVSFKPGMNTATMKHYIDFASASGFAYMLIDAG